MCLHWIYRHFIIRRRRSRLPSSDPDVSDLVRDLIRHLGSSRLLITAASKVGSLLLVLVIFMVFIHAQLVLHHIDAFVNSILVLALAKAKVSVHVRDMSLYKCLPLSRLRGATLVARHEAFALVDYAVHGG